MNEYERELDEERVASIIHLTYGRARLCLSYKSQPMSYADEW